ncbi:MAG: hypothetical protein H0T84_00295 [Tatlockia sp.]|nr:hypothetical protein [Tatlockia sp.]
MKTIITSIAFAGLVTLTLSSCTNRQVGTAGGAAAGAGLGYAVSGGSGLGAALGAGAGALVGNQIGADQDRRYYYSNYNGYNNRSYYYNGYHNRPYYYY